MRNLGTLAAAAAIVFVAAACSSPDDSATGATPLPERATTATSGADGEPYVPLSDEEAAALPYVPLSDEEAAALAALPDVVDLTGAPAAIIDDTGAYYRLRSVAPDGPRCLEGNRVAAESFLGGASFRDTCLDVTGQLWQFSPSDDDGYYTLSTRQLQDDGHCLDRGDPDGETRADQAVHLARCNDSPGQLWRLVDAGGAFRIQSQDTEAANLCVEGNAVAKDAVLGGAAFLDGCQEVSSQVFELVTVDDGTVDAAPTREEIPDVAAATLAVLADTSSYFRFQTVAGGDALCLEGNRVAPGSVLGGAAFMDTCTGASGQLWQVITTDRADVYRLQTQFLADVQACLEGNEPVEGAPLAGAAYMASCGPSDGQGWLLVDAGDGAVRLTTEALHDVNACLTANRAPGDEPTDGASMTACREGDDQRWLLVPEPGTEVFTAPGPRVADTSDATSDG